MTQKSEVENHTLAHKLLDTKNLFVFVVSVWLFFFYVGTLYLFVLAHHRTGWRELEIKIFGEDSKQEKAGHANLSIVEMNCYRSPVVDE